MGKILAGIFGGFLVAFLGSLIVTWSSVPHAGSVGFFVIWGASLFWCMWAKSGGKAWRYMLITAGLLCFLLPLSGIIFTGHRLATDASATASTAATAGTMIGGGLITGFLGVVGFFLGIVFLVIGLLIGRDKQIVVIQQTTPTQ